MNLDSVRQAARQERLYPSLILYGTNSQGRKDAAVEIARLLLCEEPVSKRPCSDEAKCAHCHRIDWTVEHFHPDFHILERDLRTATSTGATKKFLAGAYAAPFEARGQVFVITEADSLSGGAADSLLKLLEEPPSRSPRHFLLLAASRLDLLPTIRSRSMAIYLGSSETLDSEEVGQLAIDFGRAMDEFANNSSPIYLLTAAETLGRIRGWEDPRARKPWATACAAILRYLETPEIDGHLRRNLLALGEALLDGSRLRVRGITHGRILEGLMAQHLTRS